MKYPDLLHPNTDPGLDGHQQERRSGDQHPLAAAVEKHAVTSRTQATGLP